MKTTAALTLILGVFLAAHAPARAADMNMPGMDMSASKNHAETEAVGVVDEINSAKGIVTLSHEPIKSLNWPAMTMDFVVKDRKVLGKLQKGKKVTFFFVEQRGDYVITKVK